MTFTKMVKMLWDDNQKQTSTVINAIFTFIGKIIQKLCMIAPESLLNYVAQSLEIFAVISYTKDIGDAYRAKE
jgi:hypothetical protein